MENSETIKEQCRILKITSEYPEGEQKLFEYDSVGNLSITSYIGTQYGYHNYYSHHQNEVKCISFPDAKPDQTYTTIKKINENGSLKELIALHYYDQKDCTVCNYTIPNEINTITYITGESTNRIFRQKITFNDTKKLFKYYNVENDDSMTLYQVRTYVVPTPKSFIEFPYFEDYNHELLLESIVTYNSINDPNYPSPSIAKRVTYQYILDARGNIEKVVEEEDHIKRSYRYEYQCFSKNTAL